MGYTGWNPWDVLGVPEDAPFDDVKRAYLRRARATHPDVPGGSAEAFRRVQAAFEQLQRRPRRPDRPAPTPYDRWLNRPAGPARQWIDDDPLVAQHRRPSFADLLSSELGRRRSDAA